MPGNDRKGDAMDAQARQAYVTGELGYVVPTRAKAFQYMYDPPPGAMATNCAYDRRCSRIHDARRVSSLALDANGFELADAPSAVADFYDEAQVREIYYREVEELALHVTGGARAVVFDHLLRKREEGRPSLTMGRRGDGSSPAAVGRVHNDYTETSGRRRFHMVFPHEHEDHPFVILNFWRPVMNPAIDTPLAVCDARSFPGQDWMASDIIYPDRTGEIYLGKYSGSHQWYYYPAMEPGEVLVFKSYDSRLDMPARMTPHCAFDDETAPADAPLRRSIEARCIVILD